jgi:hypothetical protein
MLDFDYRALQGLCWIRYLWSLISGSHFAKERSIYESEAPPLNQSLKHAMTLASLSTLDGESRSVFKRTSELLAPFLFGTFLPGCMVRFLMSVQAYKSSSSTPFEKELKGLRLKREDIPPLFSKTIAKLREYGRDITFYRLYDQLISDLCLRENAEASGVTHEEVSAYFAFGLAQGRVFKALVKSEEIDSESTNEDEKNE